eukprot:TRINITY_DN19970_c0_g1_i2.p1 TRINITY_DN19970_c0_g1~~TRINITY_DN19970_c0_g1_i2.p1  ORF type:complete len:531 (-),score=111.82 TRINITY_DN19970_c0_g1_i2:178-1770(-)
MRRLHVTLFLIVRIAAGVPLSFVFLRAMASLVLSGQAHSTAVVALMVTVNIFINVLNVHWLQQALRVERRGSSARKQSAGDDSDEVVANETCQAVPEASSPAAAKSRSGERQWWEFQVNIPLSDLGGRAKPRRFRVQLSKALLRALFCTAVAASLCVVGYFVLSPLPEPKPIENFREALFGDHERNMSQSAVLRAQRKVDELLASGKPLRLQGEFDVVISGGGFRGQYAGGVLVILRLLEEKGLFKIQRYAGTSVGALAAAGFAAGVDFESFFRTKYGWESVWQLKRFWEGAPIIREKVRLMLPSENVHKELSGKLFVHMTQFEPFPTSRVVSEFPSKQVLFDALMASAAIPGFTGEPVISSFEGRLACDGGISRNTPVFRDGVRQQLVINLGWLQYSALHTFSPLDPHHERIVFQGMDDAVKMLAGEEIRPLEVIADGRTLEKSLFKDVHHLLIFDITSWAFYSFGPMLLFFTLTALATGVTLREGFQNLQGSTVVDKLCWLLRILCGAIAGHMRWHDSVNSKQPTESS